MAFSLSFKPKLFESRLDGQSDGGGGLGGNNARCLNVPEWASSTVVVGCKVVCIDRHFLEYNFKIFAPNKHSPYGRLLDAFLTFLESGDWNLK